jgi:hypothetical protein
MQLQNSALQLQTFLIASANASECQLLPWHSQSCKFMCTLPHCAVLESLEISYSILSGIYVTPLGGTVNLSSSSSEQRKLLPILTRSLLQPSNAILQASYNITMPTGVSDAAANRTPAGTAACRRGRCPLAGYNTTTVASNLNANAGVFSTLGATIQVISGQVTTSPPSPPASPPASPSSSSHLAIKVGLGIGIPTVVALFCLVIISLKKAKNKVAIDTDQS